MTNKDVFVLVIILGIILGGYCLETSLESDIKENKAFAKGTVLFCGTLYRSPKIGIRYEVKINGEMHTERIEKDMPKGWCTDSIVNKEFPVVYSFKNPYVLDILLTYADSLKYDVK